MLPSNEKDENIRYGKGFHKFFDRLTCGLTNAPMKVIK
jgi:hypothetical protein